MELKQIIKSEIDKTIKYIFELNKQIIEFSYVDNGSGKDIICVPCQTMCNMSCKFCHLTDHVGKIKLNNLSPENIVEGVDYIVEELGLNNRTLLISYMGCGEPLDNTGAVVDSMILLKGQYEHVRFGLATLLPKSKWTEFFKLTNFVKDLGLDLKLHLSLHFVDDVQRKEWMPSGLDIQPSIDALNFYHSMTGNPIEVHYTIMRGVNDSMLHHIDKLSKLVRKGCTIKFMMYSEREALDVKKASLLDISQFIEFLENAGHTAEYYEPPGNDIGASCGQFLTQLEKESGT
jgi:23S rRNA (adenine2503-C2)-methyltransferase